MPSIYTVDRPRQVDLVVSPYGTNLIAPAMPIVMQKGMTMMSLFGVGVNKQFDYDQYFPRSCRLGTDPGETIPNAFFEVVKALSPMPKTVAIVGRGCGVRQDLRRCGA